MFQVYIRPMFRRFGWFGLLLGAATACGSSGGSTEDAGPDVSAADVTLTDAGASDVTDAMFEHPPFPQVPNVGNRVLHSPTLVTILASNDDMAAELSAFSAIVPQSTFWSATAAEYGLGSITVGPTLVGPTITAGQYSSTQLSAYIGGVLATADAGVPPNGDTIYLVYMPTGATYLGAFSNDCGYHTEYPYGASTGDQIATVSRCTPYADQETELGAMTRVATHEIVESATDPLGKGYTLGDTSKTPWTSSIWAGWVGAGLIELGDLCEGTRTFQALTGAPDGGWEYQRMWSNAGAAAGGDPCIPPSVLPYYSVAAPEDWYTGAAGANVTIPIEGWSASSAPDWLIYPRVALAAGAFSTLTASAIGVTTDLGIGTSGTCYTRYAMNAGHTGSLTVPIPSSAASGDYVVLAIDSFREKPSPSCEPPITEDQYHFWLVGIHVP
jgi:hypothetical protein